MSEIWFSSDPHFYHEKIIKYCNRPFNDALEMNERLVEWHNAYVKPNDKWYCLGDVTMYRGKDEWSLDIVDRLNGQKRLILGNHDHFGAEVYLKHFEKVMAMNRFDNIEFTHFPIHPSSMGSAKANVHGHTHDHDDEQPVVLMVNGKEKVQPYINISIERTAYRPITLGEVKERIAEAIKKYGEDS